MMSARLLKFQLGLNPCRQVLLQIFESMKSGAPTVPLENIRYLSMKYLEKEHMEKYVRLGIVRQMKQTESMMASP